MRSLTIETTTTRAVRLVEQPNGVVLLIEQTLLTEPHDAEIKDPTSVIASIPKERRNLLADFLRIP